LFMAISKPDKNVWLGMYWIILLFASVNAIAKSFLQESKGRMLYYYIIAHPVHFIIAKLLFNAVLMIIICIFNFALVHLLLHNPIEKTLFFTLVTLLGGLSLSSLFTLLSAIAAKAQQNAALMAILGFPLVIPLLLILIRASLAATTTVGDLPYSLVAILFGYNVLIVMLSIILYPFIWKE
jgi:heme exporter protein B